MITRNLKSGVFSDGMNLKELITKANQRVSKDTEQVLKIASKHKFSGEVDRILDFIRENSSLLDDSEEELEKQFGSLKQALASREPLSLKMTHGAVAFEMLPDTYNDAQDEPDENAEGDSKMNTDQEGEKNMADGEEKNEQVNQQDIDDFFSDESDESSGDGFSVSEDDIQNLLDETDPENDKDASDASADENGTPLSESEIDKIMNEKLLDESADNDAVEQEAESVEPAAKENGLEDQALPSEDAPETESPAEPAETEPETDLAADMEKPSDSADEPEAPLLEEHLAAADDSDVETASPAEEEAPATQDEAVAPEAEEESVPVAEPVEEPVAEEASGKSTEERIAGERFVLYVNMGSGPTQIAESQDKEDIKNAYLDALKKHSQNELFIERIVRKEVVVIREEKEVVNLSLQLSF